MGSNLALNLASSGHQVTVYNYTPDLTERFMESVDEAMAIAAVRSLDELVDSLPQPRVILVMITAGRPVDAVLGELVPLLGPGDIVVDGGNSHYSDTQRRVAHLAEHQIHFVGMGVSGGEEGARHGPSLMPGGSTPAWARINDIFQSIAAVAPDGSRCCDWVGGGGAGHFVKMVHNGIEYADMQVIAEAYDLMRRGLGLTPAEIGAIFERWNQGRLKSYLIEITASILTTSEGDVPLVDLILDTAGQKGTGAWTVVSSMDQGEATSLAAEAVYARVVSSRREVRIHHASRFPGQVSPFQVAIEDIEASLYASKIISYSQGFRLLAAASQTYDWGLDLGMIASLWRAGCIIRAEFLNDITSAFTTQPNLSDLTLDDRFAASLRDAEPGWRRTVAAAISSGIPVSAYSSALSYFDAIRSERLPASLIQAQRDFFGAHTFERVDRPRGEWFHHSWT